MKLYLCNFTNIDISYQNVMCFKSEADRESFFVKLYKKEIDLNYKPDSIRDTLSIPLSLSESKKYDYLFFKGSDDKYYFYFIIRKIYETEKTTTLNIVLDVMTTYQFDFEFLDCLVDRCHVNRWNGNTPTNEITDEGINIGEYEIVSKSNVYKLGTDCIYTSSTPLGKLGHNTGGGGDPGGGGVGSNVVTNFCGKFTVPTYGTITAKYPSYDNGSFHGGDDIANIEGTPIVAPRSGKVVSTSLDSAYGIHCVIEHQWETNTKCYSILAHLSSMNVNVGSIVNENQLIGGMGTTGNSTGNHLHWEIRKYSYNSNVNCISPMPDWGEGYVIPKPTK